MANNLPLRRWAAGGCLLALSVFSAPAQQSPFPAELKPVVQDGRPLVQVRIGVPAGHHLYADTLSVEAGGGAKAAPVRVPKAHRMKDAVSGEDRDAYEADFEGLYGIEPAPAGAYEVTVGYQGCNDSTCFLPETHAFAVAADGRVSAKEAAAPAEAGAAGPRLEGLKVARTKAGFLRTGDFLAFLSGAGAEAEAAAAAAPRGWVVTLLLMLLGGLALNLTPCVLPMIPINLAIIGAGAQAGSRGRGFLLGGVYGLGIALAYGALGLIVVLTKSTFGALNSNAWFNAAMAALFALLALGMFGLIPIDLSRFQSSSGGGGPRKSGLVLAFSMGAIAALLAGACVAPALISVLLLAGNLYADGHVFGLALPFLLGLGMGLPWPFAGAGLSFLPKPGGWMNGVKYGFGALILVMAVYYGWLAAQLFTPASYSPAAQERALAAALDRARAEHKPVFIDFWATWCKNCHAMDKTTFKDPAVQERLRKDFIVVRYQAEKPNAEPARSALAAFAAKGLPTYVILEPGP